MDVLHLGWCEDCFFCFCAIIFLLKQGQRNILVVPNLINNIQQNPSCECICLLLLATNHIFSIEKHIFKTEALAL